MKKSYKLFGVQFDGLNRGSFKYICKMSGIALDYSEEDSLLDFAENCYRTINLSDVFSDKNYDFLEVLKSKEYKVIYIIDDVKSSNVVIRSFVSLRLDQIAEKISIETNMNVYIIKQ